MRSSGDDSGVETRAAGCRFDGRVETSHRFSGGIEGRRGLGRCSSVAVGLGVLITLVTSKYSLHVGLRNGGVGYGKSTLSSKTWDASGQDGDRHRPSGIMEQYANAASTDSESGTRRDLVVRQPVNNNTNNKTALELF